MVGAAARDIDLLVILVVVASESLLGPEFREEHVRHLPTMALPTIMKLFFSKDEHILL